ncbi:MAG: ABC transporter ATP-binding protein [Spirochaetia bacterium]
MRESVISLDAVWKSFPSPDGEGDVEILRGVDLKISPGEAVAIVGPSGCGKTTLLSLMGGLDTPTAGRVLFEGQNISGLDERTRARIRNRRIGFVFQLHHLLPQCSAWENVLMPTLGNRDRDARERARSLLQRVGLGGRLGHRPSELSGGECLRVAVARALINRPSVLLADEPTGSLDERSARSLGEILVEVNHDQGTALVVVTHAAEIAGMMSRRCALREGRILE